MRRRLTRWLTRPSRIPASLRLALAVILGAAGVMGIAAPAASPAGGPLTAIGGPPSASPNAPAKSPKPPGAGNPTRRFPHSAALLLEGRRLYAQTCSSCHGIGLQGIPGVAPSLVGVGAGPVDFYLSTGRMPLPNPHAEPLRATPKFRRPEINALIDYVSMFGGPAAPTADPAAGSLARGLHAFTSHCAGCHQIVARGGMTVGAQVPDLSLATPQEIAEAVRMGPYLMPNFDAHQIDQQDLNSIARYVLWTRHPDDAGGWGIYNIGPIPEGIVAWFVALLALLIVARLIGERATPASSPTPEVRP